jgi:hypothetical protein
MMQNAKDTFYEVLRGRLVALNPYRTVVLRGVTRPGVLVEENELVSTAVLPDCFRLQWAPRVSDPDGNMTMVTTECTIAYETAGTAGNGGMDRGRALSAMDGELQAAINSFPRSSPKLNYAALANGGPAVAMATSVWWGELLFGKSEAKDDRLMRTATVSVMSYQEAGEL